MNTHNIKFEIRGRHAGECYVVVLDKDKSDNFYLFKDNTVKDWNVEYKKNKIWANKNVYYSTREEAQAAIDLYYKVNKYPGIAIKIGKDETLSHLVQEYLFSMGYDWYPGCSYNGNKINTYAEDYIYCRKGEKYIEFTTAKEYGSDVYRSPDQIWSCDYIVDMTTQPLSALFKLFTPLTPPLPDIKIGEHTVFFYEDKKRIQVGCKTYTKEQVLRLYNDLTVRFVCSHELLVDAVIRITKGKVSYIHIEGLDITIDIIKQIVDRLQEK